jgi:hypothetical protein
MVRVLQQRGYGMTLFPEVNVGGVLSAVESAVEREYLAFATSSRVAELLPDALISARGRLANAPIIGDVLRGAVAKVALPGIGRVDLLTQGHESESFDVEREDLRRALLILSSRELPAFKAPVDLAGGPATLVYDPEGATESLTIRYRGPGKSAVAMEWHEGSAPRAIDVGGWAIYQTTPAGLEVIDPKVVRAVMLSLTEAVRKIAQ